MNLYKGCVSEVSSKSRIHANFIGRVYFRAKVTFTHGALLSSMLDVTLNSIVRETSERKLGSMGLKRPPPPPMPGLLLPMPG